MGPQCCPHLSGRPPRTPRLLAWLGGPRGAMCYHIYHIWARGGRAAGPDRPWLLVPGSLASLAASPLPFLLLGGCTEGAVPAGGQPGRGRTRVGGPASLFRGSLSRGCYGARKLQVESQASVRGGRQHARFALEPSVASVQ